MDNNRIANLSEQIDRYFAEVSEKELAEALIRAGVEDLADQPDIHAPELSAMHVVAATSKQCFSYSAPAREYRKRMLPLVNTYSLASWDQTPTKELVA